MKKHLKFLFILFFCTFFIICNNYEINAYSASSDKIGISQPIQSRCNALIILKTKSVSEFFVSIDKLKKLNVKTFHIFPPDGIIGYIPDNLDATIENNFPGVRIYRKGKFQINAFDTSSPLNNNIALKIWKDNYLSNEKVTENTGNNESEMLCAGALYPPFEKDILPYKESFKIQSAGNTYLPYGATSQDTSEFMAGSIAIGIIIPESNGHVEDWTDEEIDHIHSSLQKGLDWWISQAPEKANLSFVYEFHDNIPVPEEPDAELEYGYKNGYQAMNAIGYNGFSVFSQTRQLNNYLRNKYKTNWAVTAFIVNRSNSKGRASFSYYGGPYLVVHDTKFNVNIGSWTAHELGHSFYAADEYIYNLNNPPICSERFGYLQGKNENAEVCQKIDSCIMRSIPVPETCIFTKKQNGMIDTDGDEIPDILDTFPTVGLNDLDNITFSSSNVSFSGIARVSPLTNLNRFGPMHNLTINKISAIEFRIDEGIWIQAEDKNKNLQQYIANFKIITPPLANGNHKIEIRAVNSSGNKSITPATRTFTVASAETSLIIEPLALNFEVNKNINTSENLPLNISFSDQFAHNWQITNANSFIQTDKTSGTGNDSVIVTVDISGKPVGTYDSNIQISASDITDSLQAVPVYLSVVDSPDIFLNIDRINIKQTVWNPKDETSFNPPYKKLEIKNTGGKSISWTSSETTPWIKLFPSGGNTPSTSLIMIDLKKLKGGIHNASISIRQTGVPSVSKNLPVTVDLCDVPIIYAVVPKKIIAGEDVAIYGDNFGDSKGNQILRFRTKKPNIIKPKSWSNKEIHIDMPEIYGSGYFTIKNDCGLSSPSPAITVSPVPGPEINLTKSRIDYFLNTGDEKIITATLGISNSSIGVLSWNLTTDVPWIIFGTTNGNGSRVVDIYINLKNFSEGKYEGNIVVTSDNAGNSPVKVPISVTIQNNKKNIPIIISIKPYKTIYKHKLTINGKYFGASPDSDNIVLIDNIKAKIISWNDSLITIKVPFGTTIGKAKVFVVTSEGKSNSKTCRILRPLPKIKKISGRHINNDIRFSINGKNFGNIEGKVLTGKIMSELLKWNNRKIEIIIPAKEIKGKKGKISFRIKTMYGKSRKKTLTLNQKLSKNRTL